MDLGQTSDPSAICTLRRQLVREEEPESEPSAVKIVPVHQEIKGAEVAKKAKRVQAAEGRFDLRHIQRFDLKVPYPEIVARTATLFCIPELKGTNLVIDQTGVGRPVVDWFRRAQREPIKCPKCNASGTVEKLKLGDPGFSDSKLCPTCLGEGHITLQARIWPVTITAGAGWRVDEKLGEWHVAKRELVSCMQVVFQSTTPQRWRTAPGLAHTEILRKELANFKVKTTKAGNDTYEAWRDADHDDMVLSIAIAVWMAERGRQKFWMM